MIIIREKFHSNVLVEHVLLTDPAVAQRVSQLAATYGKVIGDSAILKAEGLALLGAQVTREANALAYGDAFFVAGVIALLALAGMIAASRRHCVDVSTCPSQRLPLPQPLRNEFAPCRSLSVPPIEVIAVLAGIAGVMLVLYAWRLPPFETSVETTDNAYVQGYVTIISPQVSGYVTRSAREGLRAGEDRAGAG